MREQSKICTRCKVKKPMTMFRFRHNSTRLMSWCAKCKRDYDRITVAKKRATA